MDGCGFVVFLPLCLAGGFGWVGYKQTWVEFWERLIEWVVFAYLGASHISSYVGLVDRRGGFVSWVGPGCGWVVGKILYLAEIPPITLLLYFKHGLEAVLEGFIHAVFEHGRTSGILDVVSRLVALGHGRVYILLRF